MKRLALTAVTLILLGGSAFAQQPIAVSSKTAYASHFPKIAESDVLWRKRVVREVNMGEAANQMLNKTSDGPSLCGLLMKAVKSGSVRAYGEGVAGLNNPMQQSQISDVAGTGNVQKYLIVEDWLYVKSLGKIQRRIFSIAPATGNQEDKGTASFWVDYRDIWDMFNQCTVQFSEQKTASLAQVFEEQLISSKIISVKG